MNIYLKVGNYTFFRSLTSGNGAMSKAMIGETLKGDVFDFYIMTNTPEYEALEDVNGVALQDVNGVPLYALGDEQTITESDFHHGDKVMICDSNDVVIRWVYVDYLERTGKYSYILHCASVVGLLSEIQTYGGMYSSAALTDVLRDVVAPTSTTMVMINNVWYDEYNLGYIGGAPKFMFVHGSFDNVYVSGWLPVASRRDNLMQLLFATGLSMIDTGSTINLIWQDASVLRSIPSSQIYIGSTMPASDNVTNVTVTEHTYVADGDIEPITLFETTSAVTNEIVVFDQPCHTLVGSGLTIVESGANYAKVTGTGSLTGIPYVHTTIDLTDTTGLSGTRKDATVKDMTLISGLNSYNALMRLKNYYANAQIVKAAFVMNWYNNSLGNKKDRCGEFYSFEHPYTGQQVVGCLKEADLNFSEILKADSQFVVGWTPKYLGNNFTTFTKFTSDGTYTVPAGVTRIRVAICGGGQGGHGGYQAEGYSYNLLTGQESGAYIGPGGLKGEGGQPGKTLVVDLDVNPGDTITINIGNGGNGGAVGAAGSYGNASKITINGTIYTSANGQVISGGYINIINGELYATSGKEGTDGMNGGAAGAANYGESMTVEGVTYPGGKGKNAGSYGGFDWSAAGGGGAAYKTAGDNATQSAPGSGAIPVAGEDATIPGGGGHGGHGGGGHGERIFCWETIYDGQGQIIFQGWLPQSVSGAVGSAGGKGAKGFVIIYH